MLEIDKIYNGDSYKLIKEIDDNSVDLVVIDPPYEISVSHGAGSFGVEKNCIMHNLKNCLSESQKTFSMNYVA